MQKDANLVELEKCCRTHILNYFLAKFRFDTSENEPAKNLQNFRKMHFRKMQFRKMQLRPEDYDRAAALRGLLFMVGGLAGHAQIGSICG